MIQKKFSKLVGLKYEDFIAYQESGQVVAQQSKLIFDYYAGIVQNLASWNQPAPKL
jgi:hypothetical protein